MAVSNRAIVLAVSKSAAASLQDFPGSPFLRVSRPTSVGLTGGWVIGGPGMRGGIAGAFPDGLRSTLLVAWNLHPSDHALRTANMIIQDLDPVAVIRRTRDMFRNDRPSPTPMSDRLADLYDAARAPIKRHLTDDNGDWRIMPIPHDAPALPRSRTHVVPSLPYPPSADRPRPPTQEEEDVSMSPHARAIVSKGAPWTRMSLFALVRDTAIAMGVDPALALSVADEESRFQVRALSPAGAMGIMQLMPSAVKTLKISDPWDPFNNVPGGVAMLRLYQNRYRMDGAPDIMKVLAAYRSGAKNLADHGPSPGDRRYYRRVMARAILYRRVLDDAIISEGP